MKKLAVENTQTFSELTSASSGPFLHIAVFGLNVFDYGLAAVTLCSICGDGNRDELL